VLRNQPSDGQVILEWQGKDLVCKYADVRRFLDFAGLVFLSQHSMAAMEMGPKAQVLEILESHFRQLGNQYLETLGYWIRDGQWHPTAATTKHKRVALAADYALRNLFQIDRAFAVRLGRGIRRFPACDHASETVVICWKNFPNDYTVHAFDGAPGLASVELVGTEWEKFWYLQVLISLNDDQLLSNLAEPPDHGHGSEPSEAEADASGRTDITDPDRLSTIQEDPAEDEVDVMNVLDRPLTELELQSLLTHLSNATEPETAEAPTASVMARP